MRFTRSQKQTLTTALGLFACLLLLLGLAGCVSKKHTVPVFVGTEFTFLKKGESVSAAHNGIFISCQAFRELIADDFTLSDEAKKSGEKDWCNP